MPLTPDEISRKSFPSVLRGYAKWEVDEFLKDVALDYQRALGLAEWAMQRATAPASANVGYPTAPSSSTIAATVSDEFSTPAHPTNESSAPTPEVGLLATNYPAPESQDQVGEITEHIRYLAVLVNSMTQRLDSLESRLIEQPRLTAPAHRSEISAPAAAPAEATGMPLAAPVQTTQTSSIATSDWWPAESPLWVVTRDDRAKVSNSYGPRV
jgi:DivIVA domain-containing protein